MDPLKTKGIVFIILVLKTLHQMLSISMVVEFFKRQSKLFDLE